jgi:FkbM family methyltransferase
MLEKIKNKLQEIMFPLPQNQKKQGFEPNFYIKCHRYLAKCLIAVLRLNGKNRFSNEFIQMLDPRIKVDLPGSDGSLTFRTGHGRLLWRAATLLSEEPMIIEWINQFSGNDCFYDVGANVGTYSLYAARRGISTYAFEPEDLNVSLLYENIFLNQLQDRCMPIDIALGDSTNIDLFYLQDISKGSAIHGIGRKSNQNRGPAGFKLKKLVMSMDDFIEIFKTPRPTRLKIDVDGNELLVLKGALKTIAGSVRDVYIELDAGFDEHKKVFTILEDNGFSVIKKEIPPRKWTQTGNYLFRKNESLRTTGK